MAPRKKPKVDRDDHKPKVDRDDHEPKVDHDDHDHEPWVGDDTLTFNVSPAWKKSCLSSAGSKWRTFKTTLTKECVYKRIDTPYLNIPPDGSDIDLNVWKDFVISRLSDKFKQMSDEHKELAKLNK
ncbi:hypothetical protein ACS0TY_006216 [Phlomoides rotata]